jgi:hypothetical protein
MTAMALLLMAVCGLGCSENQEGRVPVYPAAGRLTVRSEIPEGALIVLYPASTANPGASELRPSARVGKDGAFRLTTYEAGDGAPVGEYIGTIEWNKLIKRGSDYVAGPNAVPKEYAGRETSPWKVTITEAANELPPLEVGK